MWLTHPAPAFNPSQHCGSDFQPAVNPCRFKPVRKRSNANVPAPEELDISALKAKYLVEPDKRLCRVTVPLLAALALAQDLRWAKLIPTRDFAHVKP